MAQPGLLEWSNDIRRKMAGDPGRQLFADQIQKDGFLFLDDYLDNILASAKQDHVLIDLVKTPSRNRTAARHAKGSSKLANIVAISFEPADKENVKPPGLFTSTHTEKKAAPHFPTPPTAPPIRQQQTNMPSPLHPASPPPTQVHVSPPSPQPDETAQEASHVAHSEVSDLSVIAEDEEPLERSWASIRLHALSDTAASSSSGNTFHSIALDSPEHHNARISISMEVSPISFGPDTELLLPPSPKGGDDDMDITGPLPKPTQPEPTPSQPLDVATAALPPLDIISTSLPSHSMDITESLPIQSDNHTEMDLMVMTENSALPPRQSVSHFPTLPAPKQLQKTPGATLGKRTSWLKKAREAKAGASKQSIPTTSINPLILATGSKRKSGDLLPDVFAQDDETKHRKVSKKFESDVAPVQARKESVLDEFVPLKGLENGEDMSPSSGLGQLRKTVEGFHRSGKSMGKSLGGAAAKALAEARAAAEARVMERNETLSIGLASQPEAQTLHVNNPPSPSPSLPVVPVAATTIPPLTLSELAPSKEFIAPVKKDDSVFTRPPPEFFNTEHYSMPTVSDPQVFHKPQTVFRPPSPKPSTLNYHTHTKPMITSPFVIPPSMSLGLGARLPSPTGPRPQPLSKQSTIESIPSDSIFESQNHSWLPLTQDTECSNPLSQSTFEEKRNPLLDEDDFDEGDSWPMDEKVADDGVQWTFGVGVEDSCTWSSIPTTSQKLARVGEDEDPQQQSPVREPSPTHDFDYTGHIGVDDGCDNEYIEANDISIDPSKMTVSLVDPSRNQSQLSLAESTNSSMGFIPRLVSNLLGKKPKAELKSIQLAAAAAKKEQEEKEKKASVLKNMEVRRQQAQQKKAEEDKARTRQEEKKIKEETERRKREREEQTDKRPLMKPPIFKKQLDEDSTKKRKLAIAETEKKAEVKKEAEKKTEVKKAAAEIERKAEAKKAADTEKKLELKKSASKPNLVPSKSTLKPTPKPVAGPSHEAEPKPKATPSTKSKIMASSKSRQPMDDDSSQPSQILHSQMAARAQAQIDAVASESIDLPDINSEYSDSDDEDRYQAPGWAQSPNIRRALQNQALINPDELFGPIQPLRMSDVFRGSRTFRNRTSSGNWNGHDRLTQEEEVQYARRMGFRE